MKKVLSFLLAVLIALGVMINNGIKANAIIAAPALLTWIIQAAEAVLIGSGAVTQNQFDTMTTSDVLDTTSDVINKNPSITLPSDYALKLSENLGKFINENKGSIASGALSISAPVLSAIDFHKFVTCNTDNLDKVSVGEGFDLKGYGCCLVIYEPDGWVSYTYAEYGFVNSFKYRLCNLKYKEIYRNGSLINSYESSVSNEISELFSKYTYKFYGDWRNFEDETPATDIITSSEAETKPADIGEVDVDGQTYPISGDGTVSIGEQTIPINEDGSVTIGDNTYYPTYDLTPYDDTAIIDLLNQILQQIQVSEDNNPAKEVVDNAVVNVPIEIANSELSSLQMPKTIATVFPFCIPWDFYNGLQLLAQKPKAPRFEVPFEIPQFGLFPGYKTVIVLDFAEYEDAFAVVRWVTFTIFMFVLCFITFKIVKGA